MKIAMLCPIISMNHPSGLVTSVTELSRIYAAQGHEVTIYSTGPVPREYTMGKVRVKEFRAFSPQHNYFLTRSLLSSLKNNDHDVIHCFGYNNLITLGAMLVKKPTQKLVLTLGSSAPSSPLKRLFWVAYDLAFNALASRIDRVVCISAFEKELFSTKIRVKPEVFTVIPCGVDKQQIKRVKATKKRQIVAIGRLIKNKGFQHVIRAFALVQKDLPDFQLVIVGSGSYETPLKQLVKDLQLTHVKFTGAIPYTKREEFIRILKESAVFISLSSYESQGLIIQDAVLAGVPSLVSNTTAMKEYVDRGLSVGVDDIRDYATIARQIEEMVRHPPTIQKTDFILSWEESAAKMLKVYATYS